jgi:phosphohistidine phosphatase
MTQLYLIRHGVAEDRGDAWPDDTKRPLTEDGIRKMKQAAQALARLEILFDVVVTSPLVRTRQTAEIVAAGQNPHPHLVASESLAPGSSVAAVLTDLEKHTKRARIAVVGHEPGIGELAAKLVGARHPIPFKKGAICRIDVEGLPPAGPGDLRWFLPPRMLRALR